MWISTVNAVFIPHPEFASWHPAVMNDLSNPGFKILLILSIIGIGPQLARLRFRSMRAGGDWVPVLVLVVAAVMGLKQSRNGGLFAICAAAYAWPWLCDVFRRTAPVCRAIRQVIGVPLWIKARNVGIGVLLMAMSTLVFAALHEGQFALKIKDILYAPKAMQFVEDRLAGAGAPSSASGQGRAAPKQARFMVPFNVGSYALWKLYPHALVSMDGRYELVYTIDTYLENENFFRARNDWQRVLKETKPDIIFCLAKDAVVPRLKAEAGWRVIYEDEWAVVFERETL
jgi:hypothetical protein